MGSHAKRVLTGLILALVLVYILFWAPPPTLALAILVLSGLGMWEFLSLFWKGGDGIYGKVLGLVLTVPVALHHWVEVPLSLVLVLSLWVLGSLYLLRFGWGRDTDWKELQLISLGLILIPGALQFLNQFSSPEILLLLATAFSSDIFAYYCGSYWGGRKLWPTVSPKKTWVGSGGGVVAAILVCLALGLALGNAPWHAWLWLGMALGLAAQWGDLTLSALKRGQEVKDSGNLLPGHGGILDRFDSVLLAVPVYVLIQAFYPLF